MTKRLKNTTGSTKTVIGQDIAAGAYYLIEQFEEISFRDNADIETDIDSGDLIFNDGSTDITDTTRAKALLNANDAASINGKVINTTAPSDQDIIRFNSTTGKWDSGPVSISAFIDTIFASDISIPSTKVLILKDIITSADIILDGELYLL